MRLLLVCVVAAVLACPAAARADGLEPVGLKDVVTVAASADGGTVAFGAFEGPKFVAWLAGNPARRLTTDADANAAQAFRLSADGRFLLVRDRRLDLATGEAETFRVSPSFQTIMADDGSLYVAQAHRLWRLAPDGSVSLVAQHPASLPGTGWAAGGDDGLGAGGFGWCGSLHRRLSLGLLDTARVAVTVRATGLRPAPSECVAALGGGAVATLGARHTVALWAAGHPVRRFRLRHDSALFLSPGGRYALAGDLSRVAGVCLRDDRFGGVYVLDAFTGAKRLVRLPRGCATEPAWAPGDARLATQVGHQVWIVDPATGATVKLANALGPLAFTPDGARLVYGTYRWSSVPVTGGAPTPVTGPGFAPDPFAPRQEPFQRDVWFAGQRAYVIGAGGALFTAAGL